MDLAEKRRKMMGIAKKEVEFENNINELAGFSIDVTYNILMYLVIKCLETGKRAEEFSITHKDFGITEEEYNRGIKSHINFDYNETVESVNKNIEQVLPTLDVDLYIEGTLETMQEELDEFREDLPDIPENLLPKVPTL